jgi:uncharacterized membrane protein HdeD (DUF308 family)
MDTSGNTRMGPSETWWLVLLEGVAAIILGLLLLIAPDKTLILLIQVVGFYLLVRGILAIVHIFVDRSMWLAQLIVGILGIIAGVVVINHPLWVGALVPTTLSWIVGIGAITIGAVGMGMTFQGKSFGYAILGFFAILIGVPFVIQPIGSAAYLPLVFGLLGIGGGIAAIVIAFRSKPA